MDRSTPESLKAGDGSLVHILEWEAGTSSRIKQRAMQRRREEAPGWGE